MAGPVLHAIAGDRAVMRQRCAWCGALLADDNLPPDACAKFTFDPQSQVAVQDGCAWVIPVSPSGPDPKSCLYLDPYVTR
jgi:hypothetical protein